MCQVVDDHSGSDVDTSTASEESGGHAWTVITSPSARAAARAKAEWAASGAAPQAPHKGDDISPPLHAPGRMETQAGSAPEHQQAPVAAAQPPPQGAALCLHVLEGVERWLVLWCTILMAAPSAKGTDAGATFLRLRQLRLLPACRRSY